MATDLQALQDYISACWPFNDEHYRTFEGLSDAERTERAARHILLHLQKEVAKLARVFEREDHTNVRNWGDERDAFRDLLICTLRAAALRGYRARDLKILIHALYDGETLSKNPP